MTKLRNYGDSLLNAEKGPRKRGQARVVRELFELFRVVLIRHPQPLQQSQPRASSEGTVYLIPELKKRTGNA